MEFRREVHHIHEAGREKLDIVENGDSWYWLYSNSAMTLRPDMMDYTRLIDAKVAARTWWNERDTNSNPIAVGFRKKGV